MKFMKRWLGIMMSVVLAAGSMQLNVYSAEAGGTAVEAETDKAERTDLPETGEFETESADEGTEKEEDSSDEDVLEGSDESVLEDTDAEEDSQDRIEENDRDHSDAEDNEQDNKEEEASEESAGRDGASAEDEVFRKTDSETEPESELTPEQVREFQSNVMIWKYDNQIIVVFDSTEYIKLEYSLYSGITDELLYEGSLQWDEESSLYYVAVDFDAENEKRQANADDYEEIDIKDTPVRIIIEDRTTQYEQVVSGDIDPAVIEYVDTDTDGKIFLGWSRSEKAEGYSVIVRGADEDSAVSVYDAVDNEIDLDITKNSVKSISVVPYRYDHDTGVKCYGETAPYDMTGSEEQAEGNDEGRFIDETMNLEYNTEENVEEAAEETEVFEALMSVVESGTCGDNLTWSLDEEGTLTISGSGDMYDYDYDTGSVFRNYTVKKAIIAYGVTSIGIYAFKDCNTLTSLTIPNSVKSIGWGAFQDCNSLKSADIPSSVTSIGEFAFDGCSGLTSVIISDSVTSIGVCVFRGCSGLTSVTIPGSVTSIGDSAFRGCSSLTNVTIPSSVTSFDSRAFEGCVSLTSVTIPSSVTSIAGSVFYGCSSLTSVSIPNSVKYLGGYVFYGCSSLTSVTISSSVTSIDAGMFSGCSVLTRVSIPSGVTSIGSRAFEGCINLISVSIPSSVTSIGSSAFEGCVSLTSVSIPNNVTSIKDSTFCGCSSLADVYIPSNVTSIGSRAFEGCVSLTSVNIPNSVASIGEHAFSECSNLTSVTIPYEMTSISSYTFNKCSNLSSVSIPTGVTSIGEGAFYGCSSLTNVSIPYGVTSIGTSAFGGCSNLTSVSIPISLTSIGKEAFEECSSLTSANIPSGVTSIGNYAFNKCNSLKNVTIPNSIKSIEHGVFSGCSSLTSVTIPNSVTIIWDYAFSGCSSLTSVTIPSSVTNIEYSAFEGCSKLTSVEIPSSVTSIGSYAFYKCNGLTSVSIPSSVTRIERGVFRGCSAVKSMTIPSSVTDIGDYAFSECSSLTSVSIPSSVTSIGNYAFYSCYSLTSVTIPNSVTSIGTGSFNGCSSLTSIYFDGNAPTIAQSVFVFVTATAYYTYDFTWTEDIKKNYGGTITWVEKPANLSDCTFSISPAFFTYDGTAKEPTVTIDFGNTALTNNTDYTLSYSSNINVGTGTITIIGKGHFEGTVTETFTISKAKPTLFFESTNITKNITDSKFTNTLTQSADGMVTFSSDNISVAEVNSTTGEVTIKGIGNATITASAAEGANYTAGTTAYTLIVMPHNISSCTVTIPEESYLYAGQAIEPPLTVQRGTVTLVRGTDYMIVYTDNINAGTATMTVAGIGNYAGTVQKTFTIAKAKPELTFASASISKKTTDSAFTNELTKKTDGTVTFMSSETGVATVNNTTGQVTIKGAGTTEITATASEGTNYTAGSASYTLTVTDASVLTLEDLTYSFANNAQAFGYPKAYKIPRSSYVIIFGDNTKASLHYKNQDTWKGSCMGFSSTAALLYDPDSDISPSDFHVGADRIFDLGVHDENTSIGMNVTQFIEAMQISQKTMRVQEAIASNRVFTSEIRKGNKNLNGLYSTVKGQTGEGIPVIIAVYQNGGHAILAYKAEDVSSTEGRIYVYDNNHPSEERYITLNRNSSGVYTSWSYDMGGYGMWGTEDSYSSISYIPYSVIAYVWEHRGNVQELGNVVRFNSQNVALFDKDDEPVATIVKGKLFTDDSRIRIIEDDLEAGDSSDDGYTLLSMPIDVYTVKNLDSNTDSLDLSVVDTNLGASVETTAKEVTFVVDDSNDLNSILIHAEEGDNYSITLNSSFESDEHDEVKITGYGKGETMEVSREDGYISINNCQILNITVDGVEVSKYTISASAGEGGSITPSGECTVIRDMDASYTVTPDNGYVIEDVKVDGKSVGAVSSYTFSKVRAGHTISATFKKSLMLPGKTTRGDMFNLANNVKVTWKAVPGAKYYKVYREGVTDPAETRRDPVIVTAGLVGWDKDPGLTNGRAYRYKIVASLTGKGDSSGDSKLSYSKVMYRLKTVVIRSVKNTEPGKVTVKYDKTAAGDSYVLQYSENQDMTGARTKVVLGANNTTYVIGGLKKGKTYYISIRVRKKVNGIDYYTTFGVPKKVLITK